MAKLYAIYPGVVTSRYDGDCHYISAAQLARLYGVSIGECVVVEWGDYSKPWRRESIAYASTLIPLIPRYSGDYSLPSAASA